MTALYWVILNVVLSCSVFLPASAAFSEECPHPEDIYPCYCEEDEGSPVIHCNHLNTTQQLTQGLKGLKDFKTWKLSFWKNEMLLKSKTFEGLTVQRMVFENSTLQLEAPQFVGLEESLAVVQLTGCFNSTYPMPKWSLGHMEKLREINLDRNRISVLGDDWLQSVHPNLRSLTLTENDIENLGNNAFVKVESLTFLYLDLNKLTTVKRSMFPSPAKDLRTINLSHNKIESLPSDIFKNMPNLRTLELADNAITTLEETTWSPVMAELSILNLSGNPIRCDFSLKWMYAIGSRRPSRLYGACDSPKRLKDKSLESLSRRDIV